MIDLSVFHLLLLSVSGWLDRREREALVYLIEEIASCGNSLGGVGFD